MVIARDIAPRTRIFAPILSQQRVLDSFRPDHSPQRQVHSLAAVASPSNPVLNHRRFRADILAILRIVRRILTSDAERVKVIFAILLSLQAIAHGPRAHPHLVEEVVRVRLRARILTGITSSLIIRQDHQDINEGPRLPAPRKNLQLGTLRRIIVDYCVPPLGRVVLVLHP